MSTLLSSGEWTSNPCTWQMILEEGLGLGLRSCSWGCHPEPWTQPWCSVSAGVSVGSDSESTLASQEHVDLSLPTQDSPLLSSPPLCAPSPPPSSDTLLPGWQGGPYPPPTPRPPGTCPQLVGAAARPDSRREGGWPPLSGGLTLPLGYFCFLPSYPAAK